VVFLFSENKSLSPATDFFYGRKSEIVYFCRNIIQMIIITGAAGFIGSCLLSKLNNKGLKDIILVDDFTNGSKNMNILQKAYRDRVDRKLFFDWMEEHHADVDFVYHIGARTDTAEFDMRVFDELNLGYSKKVWELCTRFSIPMVYASSAATYGMGEFGYNDDHSIISQLQPLNPYGVSKNEFDKWVLQQTETPPFWAGLKFFNVYGPNEYHKGRMASVIFHTYHQVRETASMKLFRSHRPDIADGEQKRDFIYVKDLVKILLFFYVNRSNSGIYNAGTGEARTFLDLARSTFHAMHILPEISFIDTPADIRDKYQYFTEANMQKLRNAGYSDPFHSLEEGVEDYIQGYLINKIYY
jgi:ADP-L-glycero-D-manno-heptose 6-epimerase